MGLACKDDDTAPEYDVRENTLSLTHQVWDLHFDMEAFAWATEQLWHHEFRNHKNNELLSRFPIAILRLAALRVENIRDQAEELQKVIHCSRT